MTLLLLTFLLLVFVATALVIFGWNLGHPSWRLHLATAVCTWAIAVVSFTGYIVPSEHARWGSLLTFLLGWGWLIASIMHFMRFRQVRRLFQRARLS